MQLAVDPAIILIMSGRAWRFDVGEDIPVLFVTMVASKPMASDLLWFKAEQPAHILAAIALTNNEWMRHSHSSATMAQRPSSADRGSG